MKLYLTHLYQKAGELASIISNNILVEVIIFFFFFFKSRNWKCIYTEIDKIEIMYSE